MATVAPTALAQAIRRVRQRIGSHDKLVDLLKENYGLGKASRTLVINWEKGSVPSGRYREALTDLGISSELFVEPDPVTQPAPIAVMQEALENQREMRGRLESLEELVAEIAAGVRDALEMLATLQRRGQAGHG